MKLDVSDQTIRMIANDATAAACQTVVTGPHYSEETADAAVALALTLAAVEQSRLGITLEKYQSLVAEIWKTP